MKISRTIAAAVAGCALVPVMASAAVIGGTNYASQYDYGEFFSIADHHDFKVVLAGNPFPGNDLGSVGRDLLPVMQAAKPRPALTFAYDVAVEKDQPDYRLMLVFNAANDLGSKEVCNGVTRANPAQPGLFRLYAVYCRNDMAMSETTAWAPAASANDPQVAELFRELFMVVFPDSHALKPQVGDGGRARIYRHECADAIVRAPMSNYVFLEDTVTRDSRRDVHTKVCQWHGWVPQDMTPISNAVTKSASRIAR